MRLLTIFTIAVAILLSFLTTEPAQAARRIQFEAFLFPDSVKVGSTRTMTMCLVNQGSENELKNDDHLVLSLPMGTAQSDLHDESGSLPSCTSHNPSWTCLVHDLSPSNVEIELRPAATPLTVADSETICFDIEGVEVNGTTGLAFCSLEQLIKRRRARRIIRRPLAVFKMEEGIVRHDDLS